MHLTTISFRRFYTLFLLVFPFLAQAQQELMLHAMPEVWHSTATNPAFFPEDKSFIIGLPGIGLDAAHSGSVSYNDIFIKDNGRNRLSFSAALDQLDPINTVTFDQRIETISLGLRLPGKIWLQAGHANRLSGLVVYPKTLPSLIWDGNAQYIGQTVDIGLQTDISNWNEWSLGLAKKLGNLQLGLRGKLLTGVGSLLTDNNRQVARVTTSDDIYQLTMETNYAFYTSSFISAFDTSGFGYTITLGDLKGKAFSPNMGYGFDFGAQYQVNDRLALDISLLDIGGKITWKENANYYASEGQYEYDGITLPGADIINGSDSLDFSTKLDTLNDIFQFQKTAQEFETALPFRGYLGGRYKLNEHWTLGLSVFVQKRDEEKATTAVGASARWTALKWLSLGAMYSVNERSAANLGFQVGLKSGPVQVYVASDNIIRAFSIRSQSVANVRAGAALVF
jgi:hypothetical protein